ncbi:PREDICTED: protein ELC-like [Nelumbo nucifera]|uniref:Protein ELC-like n=2 Tax=Nelumbo nucifera TaxID=4432 RepID=A0A1U8B0X3_NELNU|nr:PREDICTED: protein ELC-like [Nelumbo nucifera]DAD36637.1 TPA_asm: hypothetical protein HUJ06_007278 [Nelumbo nucifera]
MAPQPSIRFVDAALSRTSPCVLSYRNTDQKWLIRQHLLSLLQEFPTLSPSTDTFVHDDGTTVYLLNVSGSLLVTHATPTVPLTIWLHQDYPNAPPIVFLSPTPTNPILPHHPFVDPSGVTTSPYLQTWHYTHSNLSDLTHNLVCLFAHQHPFISPSRSFIRRFTNPSLVSKVEAIDRLFGALHCDMVDLNSKAVQEIQELSKVQAQLVDRAHVAKTILVGLEHERTSLKQRVTELTEESDVLLNWLKVNGSNYVVGTSGDEIEAFEASDEDSRIMLDCVAEDLAIEDCIYELDRTVAEGVVTFDQYMKQIRSLAREQFFHRATQMKLRPQTSV